MKLKLQIAKQIVFNEEEIDFPETAKFFYREDFDEFDSRGIVLFAIIPKSMEMKNPNYILIEVEKGKQDKTDFVPSIDTKTEYFMKNTLRSTALMLIKKQVNGCGWEEIHREEFIIRRDELLKLPE